jgi:beta-glucosidase
LAVGEDGFQTGEGRSQSEIQLPGLQRVLIEAISAVNANIILITQSGRPLDLSWENNNVKSILHAWHLGTESGNAITKLLTGEFNPSAKLPVSFPRAVGQLPIYYNKYKTGRPSDPGNDIVFWSHFTDVEEGPLFPFGYGLNYSNIKIENIKLSKIKIKEGDSITIEVTLKNHSKVKGSEVIQLYIQDLYSKYVRPIKELKDFEKVSLGANQEKVISFSIGTHRLTYFGYDGETILEPGKFAIHIGLNSKETITRSFVLE